MAQTTMKGRALILACSLLLLAATPAAAQPRETPGGSKGTEQALTGPEVRASQLRAPTAQGNRPPDPIGAPAPRSELWKALTRVWRAPPDLQGNPVERPNLWASNPENPSEPTRSENASELAGHESGG
ncbi:hypothetical protein [Azospirillum sp. SYSU D00513]|uniref:hypothetical protein n=1 Tax=Azospirillum sp. SYSU D00513 TaxID=2812561 RepID=UPI001A9714E1|nr:hypothetical protein [Azospirillum sp. SYSU D00513]